MVPAGGAALQRTVAGGQDGAAGLLLLDRLGRRGIAGQTRAECDTSEGV